MAREYDIVHFHGSSSLDYRKPLFPRGIDDIVYKICDKGIVIHYHGSNVRGTGEPLLHRTFADRRVVSTPDLLQWTGDTEWVPNPVDISDIPHEGVQGQGPPYTICHAPTDREIKGTDSVIGAVKELSRSGYDVHLNLIEGVSRKEALQQLSKADIVVDQLNLGWYGLVSIESLALGKPTCVYIDPDVKPSEFQSPLVNVTQSNLAEKLQWLIDNPEQRQNISSQSRDFVESVHHPEVVTDQINQIYRQIL
jgi:glycosyltransferase involved in cell wall biosynthesis